MKIPFVLLEVNWSNASSNWWQYAISGYDKIFEHWFYPLIFMGIIGYIYCLNRSATTAAAGICLVFGVFGLTGVFRYGDIAEFSLISWVIVIVSFSGMFTTLFLRRYR